MIVEKISVKSINCLIYNVFIEYMTDKLMGGKQGIQTHNLKAAGSNPAPATSLPQKAAIFGGFFVSRLVCVYRVLSDLLHMAMHIHVQNHKKYY